MAKIDVDNLISAMALIELDSKTRKALLEKVNMFIEEEKAEKEATKVPRRKHEHVVVIKGEGIDPDKLIAAVFTIPQDGDPATLLDSVRAAAVDQNTSRKKNSKKPAIKTFTDALLIKAKHQKERNYKGLTKEYSRVLLITPEQDEKFIAPSFGSKEEDFS